MENNTPDALIARAVELKSSIDVLERLIDLKDKTESRLARRAFYDALARFQANLPPIVKNRVAKVVSERGTYRYRYADLATIQAAIAPLMKELGLSVSFDTEMQNTRYIVRCTVHHTGGYSQAATFTVPVDEKARMNDAQKAGSALTYGRRYALCAALGIVTAEDDDDAISLSILPEQAERGETSSRLRAPSPDGRRDVAGGETPPLPPPDFSEVPEEVRRQAIRLCQRAAKTNAWAAAEEYARTRFNGQDLSYILDRLNRAKQQAAV